jgi:hypothetical protein
MAVTELAWVDAASPGEDLAYIASQVGHSSVAITATTYAKLLKPRRRSVARADEAALTPREVGQAVTSRHGQDPREGAKYFKAE